VSCFLVGKSYLFAQSFRCKGSLTPLCSTYSVSIVQNIAPSYLKPDSHNHMRSYAKLCPISIVALSNKDCIASKLFSSPSMLNKCLVPSSSRQPTITNLLSASNGSRCILPSLLVTVFSTSSVSFIAK